MFTSEMVDDAMLASQEVLPKVLLDHAFEFLHDDVNEAIKSVN